MAVYLDHNATTPLDPRVLEAMLPWLGPRYGNPSSAHGYGQAAREAVEAARERVAGLIGARPLDVVFTASATESDNAVVASAVARGPGRLVLSSLEHPAVRAACERERAAGSEVVSVAPERDGRVRAERVVEAAPAGTGLVCLMLANNEIGTLQPVAEIAAALRERGVPVLCDAVQAAGKVAISVAELGVDFLTLGAHKFNGPLGAAALWIRPGAPYEPFVLGGSQERRRRAGTENVPALVGFGVAAELAGQELDGRRRHLAGLRDRFEDRLAGIPGAKVHGAEAPRLPNTSHVAFPGADAEALAIRLDLDGFAVSTGSACSSGVVEPSRVLTAMGVPREEALASLRVSFGMSNTAREVDAFLASLTLHVAALRKAASAAHALP
jgi:cysteine desulfurase